MKAILINDDKSLRYDNVPDPIIKSDEVLVKIEAAGINRADLLQREGGYPPPPGCPEWMGLEVSGEIVAMTEGAKAKSDYKDIRQKRYRPRACEDRYKGYDGQNDSGIFDLFRLFGGIVEPTADSIYATSVTDSVGGKVRTAELLLCLCLLCELQPSFGVSVCLLG